MRRCWEETNPQWADSVRHDFEEHHWGPLEAHVIAAVKQMDHLSQQITALRQEIGRNSRI